MWFAVLGPVRVLREEREVALDGSQQRALLALLLASGEQPVGVEDLVDGLWGQDPPRTALNVLYRTVGMLRRALEPDLRAREAGRWLVRAAGGYRLVVDATSADLLRFREDMVRARVSAAEGRPAEAVEGYSRALRLWRGAAGAGITPEVRARPVFVALDREFTAAVGEAADYALAAGLSARLLPTVRAAAEREPLDELSQARLVRLLAATGHQAEALGVYRKVRERLAEDLGIDPGPELMAAGEGVLGRPAAGSALRDPGKAYGPQEGVSRPAQLPADSPVFAGRHAELAALEDHDAAGIRVICGMGGIGKTALAVHWAHQVAHRCTDGQLYVNLRGFHPSERAMSAGEALSVLLAGLGVAAAEIPSAVEARAALFRGRVAGRRMLLLLDNARDEEQVRPLLSAATGCLVVVTSRDRLGGLTGAARSMALGPLPEHEAADLLRARLGAERVNAESDAAAQLRSLCGGLPLALAIVTAHALTHPSFTLAAIAAELRRERGSLDAFTGFDAAAAPRAVFSWSYHALTPAAARLFRLLGTAPGPDISASAAASLAGESASRVRPLLAELTTTHLLTEHVAGRYLFHDLVRAYAAETATAEDTAHDLTAAQHRLLDHYLRTAHRCSELMKPGQNVIPLPEPRDGVTPDRIVDTPAALAWFSAEESVILVTVEHAARLGLDHHVGHLAWSMHTYLILLRPAESALALARIAVRATAGLGDTSMRAHAKHALASACTRAELPEEAYENYWHALRLFTGLGDVKGQAVVHLELTRLHDRQGRYPEALHHARRSLQLSRREGAGTFEEAGALNAVGWVLIRLGEHRAGLAYSRWSLALHTEIGNVIGQSFNHYTIGWAHHALGEHRAAIDNYRRSLGDAQGWHGRDHEALVLDRLGDALHAVGEHEAARSSWRAALERLYDSRVDARAAILAKLGGHR
ncbi:AfsR/SARP family transcriptional regulator [Nonomuraea guangzhouensis]|uniref:BTAD domain-containing putative transcriptional regulator n=1 Tax=Nonomuraea guangzhouensis TaxID=1291555 RepID=A0ABW4GTG3_9ACTN|nr:BTAD domain-containing putative transcriptional regulator [Nonomuraea guangzhouensis]